MRLAGSATLTVGAWLCTRTTKSKRTIQSGIIAISCCHEPSFNSLSFFIVVDRRLSARTYRSAALDVRDVRARFTVSHKHRRYDTATAEATVRTRRYTARVVARSRVGISYLLMMIIRDARQRRRRHSQASVHSSSIDSSRRRAFSEETKQQRSPRMPIIIIIKRRFVRFPLE